MHQKVRLMFQRGGRGNDFELYSPLNLGTLIFCRRCFVWGVGIIPLDPRQYHSSSGTVCRTEVVLRRGARNRLVGGQLIY